MRVSLSLLKLDKGFNQLSPTEKEWARKNLVPDFLKEVNAIIKPNIELVFHDDIFAIKGPDGERRRGWGSKYHRRQAHTSRSRGASS